MFSYQKKIPVGDLAIGMYVFQLDRSWNGTPFPLQGFHVKDESDIKQLAQFCKHVVIDLTRSDIRKKNGQPKTQAHTQPITRGKYHNTLELKPQIYSITSSTSEEIKKARSIYKDLNKSLHQVAETLTTNGELNVSTTLKTSHKVVKSVLRNPDAMIWVMKLKYQVTDIYQHAMNCAVWGAVLGREIGLKETRLEHLVSGILLSKLGLTMLTEEMAGQPFYEFQLTAPYFRHIDFAANLLSTNKQLPKPVYETIVNHEERYDGSGFPNELEGDQIPLFAQIAGIIDTYEMMLNPMFRETPLSPGEAISELYNMRGHEFDSKLVETFIQVLGLFPPGSLVELTTNELAIVTSGEREKRLQPQVLVVTDASKNRRRKPSMLDIHALNSKQDSKSHIEITKSLPAGSFDIWPHQYNYQQDSFINKLLT
ncbi:MAG: DUF3391 domain-containing protein [Pseudomonadales bacterium]|nr:DUF3391 domain-containing protein [Pseudomonadales bacterium]